MGVGIKGNAYICVSKPMLDDLCADSCGDQCGGITVAKTVQTDFGQLVLLDKTLPLLGDGVGMIWFSILLAHDIAQITKTRLFRKIIIHFLCLTQGIGHIMTHGKGADTRFRLGCFLYHLSFGVNTILMGMSTKTNMKTVMDIQIWTKMIMKTIEKIYLFSES